MKQIELAEIVLGEMTSTEMELLMTSPTTSHCGVQYSKVIRPDTFLLEGVTPTEGYWSDNPGLGKVKLFAVNRRELGIEEINSGKHHLVSSAIAELGLTPPPQSVVPAIITQTNNAEIFRLLSQISGNSSHVSTVLLATKKSAIRKPEFYNGGGNAPPSWQTWEMDWNSESELHVRPSRIYQGGLKTPWEYPHEQVESFDPIFLCIKKVE